MPIGASSLTSATRLKSSATSFAKGIAGVWPRRTSAMPTVNATSPLATGALPGGASQGAGAWRLCCSSKAAPSSYGSGRCRPDNAALSQDSRRYHRASAEMRRQLSASWHNADMGATRMSALTQLAICVVDRETSSPPTPVPGQMRAQISTLDVETRLITSADVLDRPLDCDAEVLPTYEAQVSCAPLVHCSATILPQCYTKSRVRH